MQISVGEFKEHLSRYLHLAHEGCSIVITSHKLPLVKIATAANELGRRLKITNLVQLEGVKWNGKKPAGNKLAPKVEGKTASDIVLEDRR